MYEDDSGPDEIDAAFKELDLTVELARGDKDFGKSGYKYYTSLAMIKLMMDEVTPDDVSIYQQAGDNWVAEVNYQGVTFITVVGKKLPKEWQENPDST